MAHTRVTALWSGAAGLPGYTRLRFAGNLDGAGALGAANRMRTFFDAIKAAIPAGISITFNEVAQQYDQSGRLTGEVPYAPPAAVVGTGTGGFSAPTGMVVNWITNAFIDGRKVRGRTFLVPLSSGAFSTDGTPAPAFVTLIQGAAAALATGTVPLIVSSLGPEPGVESTVVGASVPDRAAVLKSRRD